MTARVLVTGAAGFIGSALIATLVRRGLRPIAFVRRAFPRETMLGRLHAAGDVDVVVGDVATARLGLDDAGLARLRQDIGHIVHCAAHYRLSAGEDAVAINVDGTRRLLDTVADWPLAGFHHVSSITAAGDAGAGCVPEAALPRPSRFRNMYERSKWHAEEVVARHASRLPIRIYRPGIVIGDAATGETAKFDGPYPMFRLARPRLPVLIGGPADRPFPLVTVDLVADVLHAGLVFPPDPGTTDYLNLIDLGRPTLRRFATEVTQRLAGHRHVVAAPSGLLRAAARMPGFRRLSGIEREALSYMGLPWSFATDRMAALCRNAAIDSDRIASAYDGIVGYYALRHGRPFWPQSLAR